MDNPEQTEPTQQQQEPTSQPEPKPTPEQLRQAAVTAVDDKLKQQTDPTPTTEPEPAEDYTAKYQEAMVKVGRKEKELLDLKAQLESERQKAEQFAQWQEAIKDPSKRMQFFQSQGISHKDLVRDMVESTEEPKTPEQLEKERLAAEIEELRKWRDNVVEQQRQYQEQQQQMSAHQYAAKLVEDNKDKYPLTAALNRSGAIVAEYAKRQEMLPPGQYPDENEVAAYIESQLAETVKGQIQRLKEYGVPLDGFISPSEQQTEPKPARQASALGRQTQTATVQQDAPTLTNDMSASPDQGFDFNKVLRDEGPRSRQLVEYAMRKAAANNPGGRKVTE